MSTTCSTTSEGNDSVLEPIIKLEVDDANVNTEKVETANQRNRVSGRQMDMLWEFLNSNRDIAAAFNRSLQAKEYSQRMWREFAAIANAQGDGPLIDWKGWCKYWVDYKAKLKTRLASLRSSQRRKGREPSTEKPLSEIEEKFLLILGHDFGQGLSGVQVDPFTEPPERNFATMVDASTAPMQESSAPLLVVLPSHSLPLPSSSAEPLPLLSPHSQPQPFATPSVASSTRLRTPRRQARRQRQHPLSKETARRALVTDSQRRAEAAVRTNNTLDRIANTMEFIRNSMSRIERAKRRKEQAEARAAKPRDPFKCGECDKEFKTNRQLKTHIRSHTGERPYMCTICGKTYLQLGHLSDHILVHSGMKPYHCMQCEKAFYRKSELERHEKVHTGDKPYQCDICPKSFAQKNNLVMHVKAHKDERPHECAVCKKRFITRSKLVLHSNRHKKKFKKSMQLQELLMDEDHLRV